ncbi:hypothetical protein ACNVED_08240 [Legionella sp. D16C41]|uniref:hypothetical protein n=1 Tax=Legionella sp. D16C41 TaxID=3402688 RepID=UPI003AF5B4A2
MRFEVTQNFLETLKQLRLELLEKNKKSPPLLRQLCLEFIADNFLQHSSNLEIVPLELLEELHQHLFNNKRFAIDRLEIICSPAYKTLCKLIYMQKGTLNHLSSQPNTRGHRFARLNFFVNNQASEVRNEYESQFASEFTP